MSDPNPIDDQDADIVEVATPAPVLQPDATPDAAPAESANPPAPASVSGGGFH